MTWTPPPPRTALLRNISDDAATEYIASRFKRTKQMFYSLYFMQCMIGVNIQYDLYTVLHKPWDWNIGLGIILTGLYIIYTIRFHNRCIYWTMIYESLVQNAWTDEFLWMVYNPEYTLFGI